MWEKRPTSTDTTIRHFTSLSDYPSTLNQVSLELGSTLTRSIKNRTQRWAMEPGVSASDSQAQITGKHLPCRQRKGTEGLEEALRTHVASGLTYHSCLGNSSGRLNRPIQMRKLGTKSSVVGLRLYWRAGLVVIILQEACPSGTQCAKAQNPATEAVRAEALRPCPITARGAQLPQRWSSPPAAVAFSPRSKCLGREAYLGWWGLIP